MVNREGKRGARGRVQLDKVSKSFGSICAVDNVTLDIAPGEFVTLLGPSGSGKTTVLLMIAGLIEPTSGTISIADRPVTNVAPRLRDLGVVFQNYALFPHLSVQENVAFPLRMRRMRERDIEHKVRETLALVQLPDVGPRLPHELSGGQQQRVALARALVFDPAVLLLDEPLSALDKRLRQDMQVEIKGLHKALDLTVLHVTHDQSEALAMSNRVVIMREGRVVQMGAPRELYERPASSFVADFLGTPNFLRGQVDPRDKDSGHLLRTDGGLQCRLPSRSESATGRVRLMIRPERIVIGDGASETDQRFAGRILEVLFTGELVRYRVALSSSDTLEVTIPNRRGEAVPRQVGSPIDIGWYLDDVYIFSD
jgi:ABC-type Fe3+/spermidine/putrescine transport system ATPase subunit